MPFSGQDQAQREKILSGRYTMKPERWSGISDDAKKFVQSLLQTDPNVRLTSKAALMHPWITSHDTSLRNVDFDLNCVNALRQFGKASTFKRVCLKAIAWLLSTEETVKVRQQFAALDADCGGTITFAELSQFLVSNCNVPDMM